MCATLALASSLTGCSDQLIRKEADEQLRLARYDQAVETLEKGLQQHPGSALLRSGWLQARNEALARLIAEGVAARAAGKLDEAERLLNRAERFDSDGRRTQGLLGELAVERRQRQALAEAEALSAKGDLRGALRVLSEALKDNPRHADLLALQRRLQAQQRRAETRAAQVSLAETRPISLDFRDAGLRTVLDVVTRNSGISFVLDKDIRTDVRVTVYLRSVRVEDAIDLIVTSHQLSKKVLDSNTIFVYPNTPEKQREHQEQIVRVFHLANAEAKGAAAFLRSMLKMRDPFVDERSNMLALRDSQEVVELAERLIGLYDTAEAEVLLELEVLEVRTSRLLDLGVRFPNAVELFPLAASGAAGLTVQGLRDLTSAGVGVGVGSILFNLKREVGDFNTLANPRIRVRNKEKAKVLIGDKVPVVSITTGQGNFVADSISYLDVGLKLDVEPTVYADDDVGIRLNLEVSSLVREVPTQRGTLAYQVGTRSASTVLRLRDGETQLLAGLISNDERSSSARVPGLGDLPLAGRLFSSQRDETQRTELVLAVTPRVIRNLRRLEASESEIWIGTEAAPKVRAVGGLAARAEPPASTASAVPGGTARAESGTAVRSPASAASVSPTQVPAAGSMQDLSLEWQGPSEAQVAETFTVMLKLTSGMALRGAPLSVRFGGADLQLVDIEEGEFFKSDGAGTSFTKAIDASERIGRAGVLRSRGGGINGQATLVRLRFRAGKPGDAEITLGSFDPIMLAPQTTAPKLPGVWRVNIK